MTEFVVYCETHRNYLRYVSSTGTTWTDDQAQARRYPTKPAARKAAELATWLDHRPIVWAVADVVPELPNRCCDSWCARCRPEAWC